MNIPRPTAAARPRIEVAVPTALFILNLALRLGLVSKGPYSVDTLLLAQAGQKTFATGQLHFLNGTGYPFTVLLGGIFIALGRFTGLAPDPVAAVNLMSALFGAACVPLFYVLARRILGEPRPARLAAVLFSVSPIFLSVSAYGMSHTPALALILAAMVLVTGRDGTGPPRLAAGGVLLGLAGAGRAQDLIAVAPLLAYLFYRSGRTQFAGGLGPLIGRGVLWAALAVTVTLALHAPYLLGPLRGDYLAQLQEYAGDQMVSQDGTTMLDLYRLSLSYILVLLVRNFTVPGFCAALVGIFYLARRNRSAFLACLLWIAGPLVIISRVFTVAPRFLLIAVPPFCLLQGAVFHALFQRGRALRVAALFLFLMVFGFTFSLAFGPLYFRHRNALLPEFARWTASVTENDAVIITVDDAPFYLAYARRPVIVRPAEKELNEAGYHAFRTEVERLLAGGTPVYITRTGLYTYNPGGIFSNSFLRDFRVKKVGHRPYEDWHLGIFFDQTRPEFLYRVVKTEEF